MPWRCPSMQICHRPSECLQEDTCVWAKQVDEAQEAIADMERENKRLREKGAK